MTNQLYSDNNPKTTLKGTGFKNEIVAMKTIDLIKKRSINYQKSVVITMYNRAKYHPNKNEDMKKAMIIFKNWLKENKLKKRKYDYLNLELIKKYEKLADIYDISHVSRGLKKSSKSENGILEMYKKVKGNYGKLSFIPIFKNKPEGLDYDIFREKFLNARVAQTKKLYYESGKYKDLPTKQHLVLIMNGYSPEPKEIKKRLKLLNN